MPQFAAKVFEVRLSQTDSNKQSSLKVVTLEEKYKTSIANLSSEKDFEIARNAKMQRDMENSQRELEALKSEFNIVVGMKDKAER